MQYFEVITKYVTLILSIITTIIAMIYLIKLCFNKLDKNQNGKIDKEEIQEEDLKIAKEYIKDGLLNIGRTLISEIGLTPNQTYKIINTINKSNEKILEKEKKENEKSNKQI